MRGSGHMQGAAHVSPSCSGSSSPVLEPLPSASATSFPVTVLSWSCGSSSLLETERTGWVLSHMASGCPSWCHGCPATQHSYLCVLGQRWAPSGSRSPAGAARLSGLAPGWAPRVGASVGTQSPSGTKPGDSAPGCPHPTRPYQELLGDDSDADSAAGRPLQERGWG